ncbi:MAG: tyrosinase family protein, partial [Rubrobacter sp.]
MPVRRNVSDLAPNGARMEAIRDGVREMKRRPATDPTSWRFQANIHGTFDTPAQPTWNQCQHGTFFFLSWHRMYIYFFERILRDASGSPNLALPYWKWNTTRALPVAFRQPATSSNPLYESRRAQGINSGAQLPLSAVRTGPAMNLTNFSSRLGSGLSFGGQRVTQPSHFAGPHGALENQPHDGVHVLVGGPGGPNQSWMAFPETAARDPIFWLHHAMIDRLWTRWLDQGGGRQNPVNNSAWMDTQFRFYDENGQQVTMRGRDILDTVNQLDYRYDDDMPASGVRVPLVARAEEDAQRDDSIERTLLGESGGEGMIEFGAAPRMVTVDLEYATADKIEALTRAEAVPRKDRVVLNVEGVQFDARSPGVVYEVYLNLPEGTEPDHRSDYYVGNVAFFGVGGHGEDDAGGHGAHPADLNFDVTDVIRVLRRRDEWSRRSARVSFVMRGLEPPADEARSAEPA